MVSQKDLFLGSSLLFKTKMTQKCEYVANYDSQLRITLPKCIAISQKMRTTYCFLNPALYIICIYICIYISIYIYTYICIYKYMYNKCVCVCGCVCEWMCVCMCVYLCVCVCMYVYVSMFVCM